MLNLENGNVSNRWTVATFLRSKTRQLRTTSLRTKFGLGATGLLALALAPAAFAHTTSGSNSISSTTSLTTPQAVQGHIDASDQTNSSTSSLNTVINGTDDSTTWVTVNGQEVSVPENGSVHKTIQDENGQTVIDITVQNTNSVNGRTSTHSSSIQSHSTSTTKSGGTTR